MRAALTRAMPKSATFATFAATSTLAGFTSRWMIPSRCAASRPAATSAAMATAHPGASGASDAMISLNGRPSTYSMTM